ncbi:MAG: (Fe-S)-binding protein, partial [Pelosinus sp.]|nr:(Fe-S)-binding protein [Pelosinus sp.]
DFALRDMEFSNSDKFVMKRHQPGFSKSKTVFFPSCQLAASQPEYIKPIYQFLCEKIAGGVGLWLGCCGAPASWAGRAELFQQTMKEWKDSWLSIGKPDIITACPTCFYMFKNHLPDIPVEMLWTLLDRIGLPDTAKLAPQKLAIHDSCMTRNETKLQQSVRSILHKLGHEIEELPDNREHTVCCGYGGLMIYANREVAHKVINRRISQSETPYLTYCAMCHDNFLSHDKEVYHLLDLLFSKAPAEAVPGYSQRQENRAKLKTMLLEELWGEQVMKETEIKLIISKELMSILEERMILADDIRKVIAHAEATGDKLKDTETGHYIAYYKPVRVTYWVEYSPNEDGFLVHNAYSHRLEISG